MIENIVDILLNFIAGIVNILLVPIDALLSQFLPSISSLLGYVATFINTAITYIGWVVDSLCLPHAIIIIITDYLIFRLTFPLLVWFVKLAIKWYNNLKF